MPERAPTPARDTQGGSPVAERPASGRSVTPRHPFPIVGIGASAGGLEAFRRLLGALPTDTGMAYVLVQHLDPRHESILAELLSHATGMAVAEVKGDVRVEPNRVYVIPPSEDIVLADGMLKLVPRSQTGSSHMPIDSFLRTPGRGAGKPGHRGDPVRHGVGRDAGAQGDQGRGGHRLRPGSAIGPARRHAPERDRRRVRGFRPRPRGDRAGAGTSGEPSLRRHLRAEPHAGGYAPRREAARGGRPRQDPRSC